MKKLIVLFLVIVSVIYLPMSIIDAKKLSDGTNVVVRGIVTVEPGPFDVNIIFVQDETAGINVYFRGGYFEEIDRGDLVEVSGYLWTHRLNREIIVEQSGVKVISKGNNLPKPKRIKSVDINNKDLQGLLVEVEGKVVEIDRGDPRKVYIDDGSGKGMIFIRENTGILTSYFKIGMELKVRGVLGRYQAFFELWPRGMEDIEAGDVFPPEVKSVFLKDEKLYVVFNEPVDPNSVIDNKTVRISGINIVAHEMFFDNKVLIFELDRNFGKTEKIMIRFIRDVNGNKMGSRILSVDPEKDIFERRVLFDEGHGQQAGNADWVINGAYSNFADAIDGYVEGTKERISFELLSLYKVFVIPEPNKPFSKEEIDAILRFVENGGGLFLIADHGGSDRNHNGWDSPKIFNEFVEEFGFRFNGDNIEEEPLSYIYPHKITKDVKNIGVWAGTTIKVLSDNVIVLAADRYKKPYLVVVNYERGKVVAIGDSSPFDDGTGDINDVLHNGWEYGDDAKLAVNIINYLMRN
ncbi:DNA-binding protein [Thermosipho melanesiensis]|uniref:Nucleic acid binding, OB-fold, tRNA/helicase-type n=2 Tax=Thermosipho melanesiensis TaxID=46541 RepID=A6LLR8_THEM4|nr:DNA-binding protein [Thermosipho melanesiensis]ABR30869.1 nucleic acid binding, OB-fold, tRNA/helicase-type [Thermosipho melanesiensis BI429]APT73988.1 DNA-binding protein [Thermosipho melanesiensis]OOC35919.1 DNA-binding protein [Thermosipho melanesiensis]OOC38421.1 DNA-binding protein [Thermosipho melanesiensis]OOC38882.1 DNA-binding protein [Thermosipho melanesiensis]